MESLTSNSSSKDLKEGNTLEDTLSVQTLDQFYEFLVIAGRGFAGILFIMNGIQNALFTFLGKIDRADTVSSAATTLGGVIFITIGLGLLYSAKMLMIKRTLQKHSLPKQLISTKPIEVAITSILQDYVKDRELERELRKNQPQFSSQRYSEELSKH